MASDYSPGGDECSIMDFIEEFCRVGSHKMSGQIPIQDIVDLPLKTILFYITQASGSTTPHLASKTNMQVALMCLEPTIFNWCEGVLANMKTN
jgi:hypothetical protein